MTTQAATAPDRRALVEQLLRRKGIQRVVDPGIPRRRQFSPCELSFAQQRLWRMAQLNPRSEACNLSVRLRLRGSLDLEAVTFCVRALLARHEALRTSFVAIDGEPRQIVHEWLPADATVVDLRAVPLEAREGAAARVAREEARRPFDLSRAPLLRVTVVRRDTDDHVVLLTMHHIVSDGWSMDILVRDFSRLYAARTGNRPASLPPPLPVQYADFAVWQRARLCGDAFDRTLSHWKMRLAELPAAKLPADRPRPARRSGRSGTESIPLPADLAGRLRDLSERTGVTLFATWVAALNVWLHRYTGQCDLAIGVPTPNRARRELEGLIGFFVNPIVLRTKIAGHLTFDDVLNRVREVTLDAFAHQDMPYERLVEEVCPDGSPETHPFFQLAFTFHKTPAPEPEMPGLQVERMTAANSATRFNLELHVHDTDNRLAVVLHYDRDLFEPPTIVRMLGHLRSLVEAVCRDSSRPISDLPLLTEAEHHRIREWNAATRSEWEWRSVLDLLDAQVGRTPHLKATVCGEGTWIYQELQDQVNRMARWLGGLGVKPGTLVGIWMGRSRHAVAAILATLKAGAAYVPVDPDGPRTQVALQLKHAGVTVLLTDRHRVATAPAGPYVVHAIDDVRGPWLGEPLSAPAVAIHPDSLACVIYESGPAAQPTGVMVTHRGLLNYLCWSRRTFLEDGQGALCHSSLAFDPTVTSVLAPLVAGNTVYVASEQAAAQPHTDPGSIGRPLANTQLYVVTSHGQLAPAGVPGELWIGGAGVARGYLGRPDTTAARFVPDPFSGVPGTRVYRSGERARYRADGTLELMGAGAEAPEQVAEVADVG